VNNMPDAAVFATEAQFRRLIDVACAGRPVEIKLLCLEGVPRTRAVVMRMQGRYGRFSPKDQEPLDGLIVTGAEPRAPRLTDEPYWAALGSLVDWARLNTTSTIFSCLAAHAAVLHLHGIDRRRLARKVSGVFPVRAETDHPLIAGGGAERLVPHSRLNGLSPRALRAHGYEILTRSGRIGVDAFIRDDKSLFVFLQGHPEYDAATLLLEYQRDLRRFVRGDQPSPPQVPTGYFHGATSAALREIRARAVVRPSETALSESAAIMARKPPQAPWSVWSERLYSNWIDLLTARAAGVDEAARVQAH